MIAEILIPAEVDIKTVEISAPIRHWDDFTINGHESEGGFEVPGKQNNVWCVKIDIDTGIVKDWAEGIEAKIHAKVCDEGTYTLYDETGNEITCIVEDYVPNSLIPGEYGDYIIMTIDGEGKIKEWPQNLSFDHFQDFFRNDD